MDDRSNTIAGWVLGAAIVALGASIVTGEYFAAERPEQMGYIVEGVEEEESGAAPAEQPIAVYLASADVAAGEQVFKKCAACHNADPGGANGIGPNLYGVMGKPHGHIAGFAYSDVLKSKPEPWGWDNMSAWLKAPKAYAPGTKMTFAGLSKPQDRANVIAFLNAKSASPLPLPAAPPPEAAAATPAVPDGDNNSTPEGGSTAIQTEAQAAKQPVGNIGGEAAPATGGTAAQERE